MATYERNDRDMNIGFFGSQGTFKTGSLAVLGYRYYKAHIPVYSNIWLSYKHIPLKSPNQLIDVVDGYVILDEVWTFFDSRRGYTNENIGMSVISARSRKRGWDLGYSQQYPKQVDRRLRFITDYMIYCQYDKLNDVVYWIFPDNYKMKIENASLYWGLWDTKRDPYTFDEAKIRRMINGEKEQSKHIEKSIEVVNIEDISDY